ncbi:acyl carrier protein [Salinispora arenicola]|uniref:acyl carrier protein n=1 Tax=Salinispora arenicola TaxID=168697 RepID=UPI0027DCB805|nr:acyl carrier protein [Salinispora arenicola]
MPLSFETLFSSDTQVVETPLECWQRHPYWLDAAPVRQPRLPAAASVAGPTTSYLNENATAPTAEATITGELAHVLGMPVEELAEGTRLRDFGLDSMLAMRLGSRIQALFGHRVSLFEFFTDRTVGELTARIAELVEARGSTGDEDNAPPRLLNTAVADNLSDADAEELLADLTERGLLEPVSPQAPAAQPREELRAR